MDKFAAEMKRVYDFGEEESAVRRRRDAPYTNTSATFSPREAGAAAGADDGSDVTPSHLRDDAHEAADTTLQPMRAPQTHGDGSGSNSSNNNAASNTHIVKEVLGLNKTGRATTQGTGNAEQLSLETRWRNALAEETRLQELEQRVAESETQTRMLQSRANFPPRLLCVRPIVYHNLEEVPAEQQRRCFVRIAYYDWMAVCALLFVNACVSIAVTYVPYKHGATARETSALRAKSTVLALVYLTGIPLSFLLWYWRIYKACSTGRQTEYLLALLGLLVAFAQGLFVVVAPSHYGVCSIAYARYVGSVKKAGAVVPVIVVLVLWAVQCVLTVYMFVMTFLYYRRDLTARRVARTFASAAAAVA